jgi:hypothetical protein
MKNTGGPAFPRVTTADWAEQHPGMTIRVYFAAAALQGLALTTLTPKNINDMADGTLGGMRIAKAALVLADALLAELEKE